VEEGKRNSAALVMMKKMVAGKRSSRVEIEWNIGEGWFERFVEMDGKTGIKKFYDGWMLVAVKLAAAVAAVMAPVAVVEQAAFQLFTTRLDNHSTCINFSVLQSVQDCERSDNGGGGKILERGEEDGTRAGRLGWRRSSGMAGCWRRKPG